MEDNPSQIDDEEDLDINLATFYNDERTDSILHISLRVGLILNKICLCYVYYWKY